MPTWQFTLEAGPLTDWQINTLEAGTPGSAVTLSAYRDGEVFATMEAERIETAFAMARCDVSDLAGLRSPRIVGLRGDLEGSVADVVFRAAQKLYGEASTPILRHVCNLWRHEAYDMAVLGAREEGCSDRHGNRVPSVVVRPIEPADPDGPDVTIVETWSKIWHAAKAYLNGEDDEYLAWMEARRNRPADGVKDGAK